MVRSVLIPQQIRAMLMEENSPPNQATMSENEDRISNLPEGIRTHIVSFLQIEDAVMTRLLSRSWRHVWSSVTTLDFNFTHFSRNRRTQEQFVHFVDKGLSLHNFSNIQKFRLSFGLCGRYTPRINAWIGFAVGHKVQELDLDFPVGEASKLPCWLFTYEFLMVLKLNLNSSLLKLPTMVTLSRLVTLHLTKVEISDDYFIEGLFTGCPVLENLKFERCAMGNLKILTISAYGLKSLIICNCHGLNECEIKVNAPNLLFFKYASYMAQNYNLENLSSLVNAVIKIEGSPYSYSTKEDYPYLVLKILGGLGNTRFMTLSFSCIELLSSGKDLLKCMPTSFSHLKFLKLSICPNKDHIHVINFLLKSCPNLETLVIDIVVLRRWYPCMFNWGEYIESRRLVFKCMMYHLKTVEIRHFGGRENEIEFVKVFLKNAKALEKVCIRFRQGLIDLRMQTKIREMILALPRTSPNVVILFS